MKNNAFRWAARIVAVLALAVATGAWAEVQLPEHLGGIISDYTPYNATASPTGPYEMRGHWSIHLREKEARADFSAEMAMELSDYWVSQNTTNPPGPIDLSIRGQHTHHITMTNAIVTTDTSVCPANNPPTTGPGIVISNTATTTGNGGPATFEAKGASTLQVCITGGTEVSYSNVTLVYTGPATSHFGPQAIHGVVSHVSTK